MKSLLATLFLVLAACPASAADVTGKWAGTIELKEDGKTRTIPVLLVLKQEGAKLTGTGGGNQDDQHPIRKGTVEADKLLIEVEDADKIFYLDLKVDGEQMLGDIRKDDSAKMKIAVTRKP